MSLRKRFNLFLCLLLGFVIAVMTLMPLTHSQAAASGNALDVYKRRVPNYDLNVDGHLNNTRQATSEQLAAVEQLKTSSSAVNMQVRWNNFAGSPDVITGFHTAPSSDTPENAARAFVNNYASLFGVDGSALVLSDQKEAMGGY